jgi:hypothetical protein
MSFRGLRRAGGGHGRGEHPGPLPGRDPHGHLQQDGAIGPHHRQQERDGGRLRHRGLEGEHHGLTRSAASGPLVVVGASAEQGNPVVFAPSDCGRSTVPPCLCSRAYAFSGWRGSGAKVRRARGGWYSLPRLRSPILRLVLPSWVRASWTL